MGIASANAVIVPILVILAIGILVWLNRDKIRSAWRVAKMMKTAQRKDFLADLGESVFGPKKENEKKEN